MIKVMNLVGILAAPFTTVAVADYNAGRLAVVILSVVLLTIAVVLSKRGAIGDEVPGTVTKAAA